MKIERRVIRRTPMHWMARPTFEFINGDLVGMNEFALENRLESFWAVRFWA
jgi:hypothetical protein